MIIGIDISSIPYGTGVSDYTLNLVRNLLKIDKVNTYKLFFSSFRQPLPKEISTFAAHPNVKIYHFHLPPSLLEILWNRLHWFPVEQFIGPCDVFHTWEWTQPPVKTTKTITTVHDFVPFLFPENQDPKTITAFTGKFHWASLECSHFICVSKNTQADLLHLFPKIPISKTSVIYEAAEDKYEQFQKLSPAEKKEKTDVISHQYGLKKFILAQGTREPRKNLDRLVSAFLLFKTNNPKSTVELAICGKYGWGKDVSPPDDNSIKILGYIPEKDMVALHASAVCLCYPSLYEGFGLPVVKSMEVGTPVITSDNSSLPEITGQAAILVNPVNVQEIAMALENVIKSLPLRRKLINLGLHQSLRFSWSKTASETLKLYESL
jgi:glycosyltransferase involved in cell wall biosynthesis